LKTPRFLDWTREPIFRVVRRGWKNPIDTSYSRTANHRWNTPDFEALYCCASAKVARAVTLDIFRTAGVVIEDLRPEVRPQLVELAWQGRVVDVATAEGVRAAGFPVKYPQDVGRESTQAAGARWYGSGAEGVICRSASLERLRFSAWAGDYAIWSEIAIYPANAKKMAKLLRRSNALGWLQSKPNPAILQ
jgi:RES domain-containing protein